MVEVAQAGDSGNHLLEDQPGPGTLDRQSRPGPGLVGDRHPHPVGEAGQVGQVGAGGGQEELVGRQPEHHPVFHDVAVVVAPDGVLRPPGSAAPDVTRQHPAQEPLGLGAHQPVLVERRGVEDAGTVAHRQVLELLRELVLVGHQVAGPVTPQAGLVERRDTLVEGGGADHVPTLSLVGRVRNSALGGQGPAGNGPVRGSTRPTGTGSGRRGPPAGSVRSRP